MSRVNGISDVQVGSYVFIDGQYLEMAARRTPGGSTTSKCR